MEQEKVTDKTRVLTEMLHNPRISLAGLAVHMGWDKSKAQRYVNALIKDKLVKKNLELWEVSKAQKAKMNGSGGCAVSIVSAVSIRADTVDTNKY